MDGNGIEMRNAQGFTESFLGLLFSRSGIKQRKTRVWQGHSEKVYRKKTLRSTEMGASQGLIFLTFERVSENKLRMQLLALLMG